MASDRDNASGLADEETAGCWFEEPDPGDRSSWAIPRGHGIYQEMDLELLDPSDDDELMILVEAMHEVDTHASGSAENEVEDGGPFSPSLHAAMHHVVARQLMADDPVETWQTVQRLAGLGYDWHNTAHMIAELVAHDVDAALTGQWQYDRADYARRLGQLPGGWPPPEELR